MAHPFEVEESFLLAHLDEMVDVTFADIQSQFLVMPKGHNFVEFASFQDAYEVLKQQTDAFARFDEASVWNALRQESLALLVLRTVLGLSPPEWADLAKAERNVDVPQNMARLLDTRCRSDRAYFSRNLTPLTKERVEALVSVAVEYITKGSPAGGEDTVHRLNKFDTSDGVTSLQHAAGQHVPYAVLLYERYLGRPFASHSGLNGTCSSSLRACCLRSSSCGSSAIGRQAVCWTRKESDCGRCRGARSSNARASMSLARENLTMKSGGPSTLEYREPLTAIL